MTSCATPHRRNEDPQSVSCLWPRWCCALSGNSRLASQLPSSRPAWSSRRILESDCLLYGVVGLDFGQRQQLPKKWLCLRKVLNKWWNQKGQQPGRPAELLKTNITKNKNCWANASNRSQRDPAQMQMLSIDNPYELGPHERALEIWTTVTWGIHASSKISSFMIS